MRRFSCLLFFLVNTYNRFSVNQAIPANVTYGKLVSEDEFPSFVVSIALKGSFNIETHYCGGSLITSRHVLTSAHCRKDDITRVVVRAAFNDLGYISRLRKYTVKYWITYDEWAPLNNESGDTVDNDISIIKLFQKVDPSIKPARISEYFADKFYDTQAKTALWADTATAPPRKVLKINVLKVLSPEQFVTNFENACDTPYRKPLGSNLIATIADPPKALEPSNSGSPLYVNDNEIIGINDSVEALHNETCVFLKQNLHISVDNYRNFIRRLTKGKAACVVQ